MNTLRKLTLGALFSAFTLFLFSCEVGLGASVDTYPPTLTLEYPANDGVVIRNTFMMSGVAKDETYIKKVEIFVKSVKDNSMVKAYTADLDSKAKTWSCKVNRKDENGNFDFPDGEYTFETIATDSSGRTTELSRVYKIDNTAPIVVIKKPKLEQPYGRTIKVTGDIADQNEISALYFTAYVNEGTEETPSFRKIGETQEFTSLSKSGLEIIVGRYFDSDKGLTEEEKTLKAVYDAFYDAEKGGTQEAFCLIEVSDEASEFPGDTKTVSDKKSSANRAAYIPGAGTCKSEAKGNLSSCYYLDSQIHKQIYNDRAKNGWQLTNNDLISIFNGTFTDTADVKKETVKNYLAENCISTTEFSLSASVFSMNPENNPTYEVAGFDPSEKNIITKNTKFSVVVKQGRDQTELDTDTIRIVLDLTENGKTKYTGDERKANEIVLLESYNNIQTLLKSEDENEKALGTLLSDARKATVIADFDTSYQYTLSASGTAADGKTYSTGKSYVVRVEGGDLEDNDIIPEDDVFYEFLFKSGSSPILEITGGTENNAVQAIPDFKTEITAPVFSYSGTLKTDAELSDIKIFYTVSVKDEKAEKGAEGKTVVTEKRQLDSSSITTSSGDEADNLYNWSIAFDGNSDLFQELQTKASNLQLDLTSGLYLYTFSFYADVGDDNPSQTVTSLVHVDNKKPTATISGITPTVIYSEDAVLPYSDLEPEVTYINGKIQVKGTLDDNYQLEKSVLSAFILDDTGKPSETPIVTSEVGGSMSFTFEIDTLSDLLKDISDGTKMLIQAVPFDAAGNQGDAAETTVTIDQRTDKPLFTPRNASKTVSGIEDISADKNMFGLMSNNKIMADISDDDGIYSWTAYYSTDNGNTWVGYPNTPFDSKYDIESTTASIEINLKKIQNLAEGSYKIRVIVTDVGEKGPNGKVTGSERASDDSFVIAIDEAAPSINITSADKAYLSDKATVTGYLSDGSGEIKTFERKMYRIITSTVSEEVEIEGVLQTVEKQVTTEELIPVEGREDGVFKLISKLSDKTGSAVVSGVSFTDEIDLSNENNPGRIEYTATDKYGRETTQVYSYFIDKISPSVTVENPPLAEDGTSKTTYLPQSAARLSVKGSADDNIINAISRVEYLVLEGDNVPTGVASEKWTALTGTGSWSGSIDFTESSGSSGSSEKTVFFRAVDNAGNYEKLSTSEKIQSRKVVVDAEKPVFENVTIKSEEKDASEDAGTYYVQGAYTLSGKLVETYLKSLTINGVDVTSDSQILTRNDDGTYTFTYTVSEPAEGQDTLSIIAVDKAEQQTLKSFNIYCDKVNPTPSFNLTPLVSANDRDNNVNGTVTIKATVTDDDKVSKSHLTISKKLSETESEIIYNEDTSSPTNFTKLVPITKFTEENGYTLPGTSTNVKLTDKTTYIIELTSYDRAGRTGKASAEVYLDESTDKPIVELSNTNVEIASFSDVSMESGHNLFNQTSNNKMLGLITDDDGIRSIRIEYAPVNADGTVTESFRELLLKGNPDTSIPSSSVVSLGTTFTLSADLKDGGTALAEGKYKIRLSVLDITDEAANHETKYEYFVGLDIGAPAITVTTNAGYQPDTFTVEGRADDDALNAIYRYELVNGVRSENPASKWIKSNDSAANTIEYNASTKIWKDNYSGVTEGGNVIYVAEDEYGQSTEVSWSYLFDNTSPTTAPGWTPTDMSAWRNDKAPNFTLPISDQWNVSESRIFDSFAGISTVNIKVDSEPASSMVMGNTYTGISQVIGEGENARTVYPYNEYNSTLVLTDGEHAVV
ncbi:MAG: Ig-like domain repeat protein, partial [Treponema sp.]|nr:Ig-like domain repeat protein [Treponema sp.]